MIFDATNCCFRSYTTPYSSKKHTPESIKNWGQKLVSFFAVLKSASCGIRFRCHFETFFIRGLLGLEQKDYQNLLLAGAEKGRYFVQSGCLSNRAAEVGSSFVGDFCPGVCAWSVSEARAPKKLFRRCRRKVLFRRSI